MDEWCDECDDLDFQHEHQVGECEYDNEGEHYEYEFGACLDGDGDGATIWPMWWNWVDRCNGLCIGLYLQGP